MVRETSRVTPLDEFVSKNGPICYGILKPGSHCMNGVPVIKVKNIMNGLIDERNILLTSPEIHRQYKRSELKTGDLLLTIRGTTGRVAFVPPSLDGANITQDTARVRVTSDDSPIYLYYALQSPAVQRQIKLNTIGQAVKGINIAEVKKLMILHPSKEQQERIAQIVSTWDKAIETIEKLIKNSKAQKKALMQRLLHKKVRLSGYSDYWVTYKLGDCCQICTGSKDLKDKQEDGRYPFFVRSKIIQKIDTYSFDGEAILIPGEGGVGEIIHYINGKFDYHQRVYKLSDFKGLDGRFLYYYLQEFFKREVNKNAVRATVDSLRLPIFKGMRVIAPPSLEEQRRIAQILNNLDDIIFKHEQQLIAARSTKTFLMQQLLTGKRRVKVSNTKATKAVA
jgi:type I restriction enzyme, S subunit